MMFIAGVKDFVNPLAKATVMTRLCAFLLVALLASSGVASAQDTVIYYHTDAIGSVRAITDATGQVIARYDYQPFGEACGSTCGSDVPDTRQFAGKERDADTGLDYFGARYYEAVSGRFTTVDPILDIDQALLDPQQWNRYAYVRNNPLRFTDPDGKILVPVVVFLAAAFILNNATNVNVTSGPRHSTIVPNSAIVAAGYGLAASGVRAAGKEVFEEVVENTTGLPVGGLPSNRPRHMIE
jgi:RHS repeat-associated protein